MTWNCRRFEFLFFLLESQIIINNYYYLFMLDDFTHIFVLVFEKLCIPFSEIIFVNREMIVSLIIVRVQLYRFVVDSSALFALLTNSEILLFSTMNAFAVFRRRYNILFSSMK